MRVYVAVFVMVGRIVDLDIAGIPIAVIVIAVVAATGHRHVSVAIVIGTAHLAPVRRFVAILSRAARRPADYATERARTRIAG